MRTLAASASIMRQLVPSAHAPRVHMNVCVHVYGRRAGGQRALTKLDQTSSAVKTAQLSISGYLTHAALTWPRFSSPQFVPP